MCRNYPLAIGNFFGNFPHSRGNLLETSFKNNKILLKITKLTKSRDRNFTIKPQFIEKFRTTTIKGDQRVSQTNVKYTVCSEELFFVDNASLLFEDSSTGIG